MLSSAKSDGMEGFLLFSCPQCARHPEKAMMRQRRRTRQKRMWLKEARDGQ